MLAAVQDKQKPSCAERLDEGVEDWTVRCFFYSDRGSDGRCNQPRIGDGGKLSQLRRRRQTPSAWRRGLDSQTSLFLTPARPCERHQTRPGQENPDLAELTFPSHKARGLPRQIMQERWVIE